MTFNDELAVWREQWQSAPAVPIHLIQRVERQTARMQMLRAAEIAVTIVMGSGVLAGVAVHPGMDRGYWLIFAAGTWLFIAALWVVSLRSTRGAWQPAELTTAAYVSLQVERLRRELEGTLVGTIVAVLLSAFVLFVVYLGLVHSLTIHGVQIGRWDFAPFWVVGGVVNLFVVLAQIGRRRRIAAELAKIADIQRRLEPPSDKPAA
jgi:hypothetical protein